MYARVSHILLSLLGPVYFGYMHSPYVVLVGGALWKLTASSRGDRSGSSRARLTIAVSILSGILFQIRRGLGLPSSRASIPPSWYRLYQSLNLEFRIPVGASVPR